MCLCPVSLCPSRASPTPCLPGRRLESQLCVNVGLWLITIYNVSWKLLFFPQNYVNTEDLEKNGGHFSLLAQLTGSPLPPGQTLGLT